MDVLPRAEIARSNASQHWYELANGSRIWLFGLDPDPSTRIPSKVGSVELGWAFVDEVAECSLADWVMVKGRLSWPGIGYHQITAATNPAAPGHWLKRRFTPPSPSRVYLPRVLGGPCSARSRSSSPDRSSSRPAAIAFHGEE